MGSVRRHRPVLLIVAAFSRHPAALEWGREQVTGRWGQIRLVSPRFEFVESAYYERQMGADLRKEFYALETLMAPERLPDIKLATNALEAELAGSGRFTEPRPLNLDPGYLTEAKLVLASTKDHHHRLYLRDGIFAEGTLIFQAGAWQIRPWTYPDYQRSDYHQFFLQCRDYLRSCYHGAAGDPPAGAANVS